MKRRFAVTGFVSLVLVVVLGGCASTVRRGDFVRSVDTGSLRTYEVRGALTTGFDWSPSDAMVVERLSAEVLEARFNAKGYQLAGEGVLPDFIVTPTWRKYAGHGRYVFSPGGPAGGSKVKRRPAGRFSVQYALVLEIHERSSGELFWRSNQRGVFEAIRFSEQQVTQALERGVQDFPAVK